MRARAYLVDVGRRVARVEERAEGGVLEDKHALREHATYTVVRAQVVDLLVPYRVPELLAHELDALERLLRARPVLGEAGGERTTYRSTRHAPTCVPTASMRLSAISASSALESAGGTRASGSSSCSWATISLARRVLYAALAASVAAISIWSTSTHVRSIVCATGALAARTPSDTSGAVGAGAPSTVLGTAACMVFT